jgi:hypothetical protein
VISGAISICRLSAGSLVASEHLYNMTNLGLNIHSDMLCDISRKKTIAP